MSVLSDRTRRYTLSILLTFALSLLTITQPRVARALDFTVSGTFRYANSSSGSTYSFVRDAFVAVYINGSYANQGTTNSSGYFSIAVNNIPFNNFSVFIRVFAKRSDNKIDIKDSGSNTYYQQSASLNCNSCSTLSFGTVSVGGVYPARAFFIFDRLGVDTLAALAHSSIAWTPSANVSVSYPSASTEYLSNIVYIKGNNGLAGDDGYAASPIIHEYGHATMDMVYGSYPAVTGCANHGFGSATTTSCAWTEGWADYFQAWVRNIGNYVFWTGTPVNLETLDVGALGPISESAVAAALWDIYDTSNTNEPWDQINLSPNGAGPIWDVFKNGTKPDAIGKFQKDWVTRQSGTARKVAINFCAHQAANGCVAVPFAKK